MAEDTFYPEQYRLEITGDPFTARYLQTDPGDRPAECILPEELHSIPSLPPITVELPPMECNFDIEEPVIPLPYVCIPTIDGGIGIDVCDVAKPFLGVDGNIGIGRKPGTECDFELTGQLNFCMP